MFGFKHWQYYMTEIDGLNLAWTIGNTQASLFLLYPCHETHAPVKHWESQETSSSVGRHVGPTDSKPRVKHEKVDPMEKP